MPLPEPSGATTVSEIGYPAAIDATTVRPTSSLESRNVLDPTSAAGTSWVAMSSASMTYPGSMSCLATTTRAPAVPPRPYFFIMSTPTFAVISARTTAMVNEMDVLNFMSRPYFSIRIVAVPTTTSF